MQISCTCIIIDPSLSNNQKTDRAAADDTFSNLYWEYRYIFRFSDSSNSLFKGFKDDQFEGTPDNCNKWV